jgi:hypothetical protein
MSICGKKGSLQWVDPLDLIDVVSVLRMGAQLIGENRVSKL